MRRLSRVPRASLEYRPRLRSEWETSARDGLREVAPEFTAYGYRRLPGELKRRGWQLRREAPAALEQALSQRQPAPGLVRNSNCGSKYAFPLYVQRLEDHQIVISMSRKGNVYDNAFAESFIKTLKVEEVYGNEYETPEQAQADIGHFLTLIYNGKRQHPELVCPPARGV